MLFMRTGKIAYFIAALALIFCLTAENRAVALSAGSAVLFEPETGTVLFERDAHKPRSIASTTKIMTALIALEALPHDKEIVVTAEAVRVEGTSLGLRGGDKISLIDLVTGMMLASGNDAANAVAYAVSGGLPAFSELMNARAANLGMKNSHFVTPSGLDADGHMSTAYDMALLAAAAMNNPDFAKIAAMTSTVIRFGNPPRDISVANHNRLLTLYEHAVGIKTGFTTKAGRCLVSAAEKDGIRLIAVTLNASDDWNDHKELYNGGFPQVTRVPLSPPSLTALPVTGGTDTLLPLTVPQPPSCIVLEKQTSNISTAVCLPRFVIAPVNAGEKLGSVTYTVDGRTLFTCDITAAESISARPVAGYRKRVMQWFGILIRSIYS